MSHVVSCVWRHDSTTVDIGHGEIVMASRNKARQRDACFEKRVPVPQTRDKGGLSITNRH
jgi:hypothetical protein